MRVEGRDLRTLNGGRDAPPDAHKQYQSFMSNKNASTNCFTSVTELCGDFRCQKLIVLSVSAVNRVKGVRRAWGDGPARPAPASESYHVIRKEAGLFCRTSASVRLWWELEEPKGPEGSSMLKSAPGAIRCVRTPHKLISEARNVGGRRLSSRVVVG